MNKLENLKVELKQLLHLLRCWDEKLPLPDIYFCDGGDIDLTWTVSGNRIASASIDSDGIGYAIRKKDKWIPGEIDGFFDEGKIPKDLIEILK